MLLAVVVMPAHYSSHIPITHAAPGVPLWSKRFGGAYEQVVLSVVVDRCGNVLVTGPEWPADFGGGPLTSAVVIAGAVELGDEDVGYQNSVININVYEHYFERNISWDAWRIRAQHIAHGATLGLRRRRAVAPLTSGGAR